MPLLKRYEELFSQDEKLKGALELMYIDILEFHANALRFFRGKGSLSLCTRKATLAELR